MKILGTTFYNIYVAFFKKTKWLNILWGLNRARIKHIPPKRRQKSLLNFTYIIVNMSFTTYLEMLFTRHFSTVEEIECLAGWHNAEIGYVTFSNGNRSMTNRGIYNREKNIGTFIVVHLWHKWLWQFTRLSWILLILLFHPHHFGKWWFSKVRFLRIFLLKEFNIMIWTYYIYI